MKHDFIENNIIILSKQTLDLFLKQDFPADLIALYCFYYYTAKWQETNQPKVATSYTAKGLRWDTHKVIARKKQLIDLGLIEDVRAIDTKTGRVKGWYIKLKYIWKQDTITPHESQNGQIPQSGETHPVESNQTNALSVNNINALSVDNKMLAPPSVAEKEVAEIIYAFKEVNPAYKKLFMQQPQRDAVKNLLAQYGFEDLKHKVGYLKKIIVMPYAPRITTPYMLEMKMGDLVAFMSQERKKAKQSWTVI